MLDILSIYRFKPVGILVQVSLVLAKRDISTGKNMFNCGMQMTQSKYIMLRVVYEQTSVTI